MGVVTRVVSLFVSVRDKDEGVGGNEKRRRYFILARRFKRLSFFVEAGYLEV